MKLTSRLYWYILTFVLLMFLGHFHQFRVLFGRNFSQWWIDSGDFMHLGSLFQTPEPTTTEAPNFVVDMEDQKPPYKLTLRSDDRPYLHVDRARVNLLDRLRLYETCQKDPSTVVVDIGAHLGDFGLYAAACGCTVFMYEVQPDMIKLLRSSMKHNLFSAPRVRLIQRVVNNLPSNTTVVYPPGDGSPTNVDNPVNVKTIRLDDMKWPSSKIFMLRVDIEGAEMNALRSATNLFAEKRIQHLLFRYSPWTAESSAQKTLLPHLKKEWKARFIFTLFQSDDHIYGPLRPRDLNGFHEQQLSLNIPANVYALFDEKTSQHTLKPKRYHTYKPAP